MSHKTIDSSEIEGEHAKPTSIQGYIHRLDPQTLGYISDTSSTPNNSSSEAVRPKGKRCDVVAGKYYFNNMYITLDRVPKQMTDNIHKAIEEENFRRAMTLLQQCIEQTGFTESITMVYLQILMLSGISEVLPEGVNGVWTRFMIQIKDGTTTNNNPDKELEGTIFAKDEQYGQLSSYVNFVQLIHHVAEGNKEYMHNVLAWFFILLQKRLMPAEFEIWSPYRAADSASLLLDAHETFMERSLGMSPMMQDCIAMLMHPDYYVRAGKDRFIEEVTFQLNFIYSSISVDSYSMNPLQKSMMSFLYIKLLEQLGEALVYFKEEKKAHSTLVKAQKHLNKVFHGSNRASKKERTTRKIGRLMAALDLSRYVNLQAFPDYTYETESQLCESKLARDVNIVYIWRRLYELFQQYDIANLYQERSFTVLDNIAKGKAVFYLLCPGSPTFALEYDGYFCGKIEYSDDEIDPKWSNLSGLLRLIKRCEGMLRSIYSSAWWCNIYQRYGIMTRPVFNDYVVNCYNWYPRGKDLSEVDFDLHTQMSTKELMKKFSSSHEAGYGSFLRSYIVKMSFVGPNGAVEEYKDPVVENLLHLYTFYYCNAGDLAVCLRLLYELTAWLAFTETYREAIQKAPPLAWRVLDYYSNVNFITYIRLAELHLQSGNYYEALVEITKISGRVYDRSADAFNLESMGPDFYIYQFNRVRSAIFDATGNTMKAWHEVRHLQKFAGKHDIMEHPFYDYHNVLLRTVARYSKLLETLGGTVGHSLDCLCRNCPVEEFEHKTMVQLEAARPANGYGYQDYPKIQDVISKVLTIPTPENRVLNRLTKKVSASDYIWQWDSRAEVKSENQFNKSLKWFISILYSDLRASGTEDQSLEFVAKLNSVIKPLRRPMTDSPIEEWDAEEMWKYLVQVALILGQASCAYSDCTRGDKTNEERMIVDKIYQDCVLNLHLIITCVYAILGEFSQALLWLKGTYDSKMHEMKTSHCYFTNDDHPAPEWDDVYERYPITEIFFTKVRPDVYHGSTIPYAAVIETEILYALEYYSLARYTLQSRDKDAIRAFNQERPHDAEFFKSKIYSIEDCLNSALGSDNWPDGKITLERSTFNGRLIKQLTDVKKSADEIHPGRLIEFGPDEPAGPNLLCEPLYINRIPRPVRSREPELAAMLDDIQVSNLPMRIINVLPSWMRFTHKRSNLIFLMNDVSNHGEESNLLKQIMMRDDIQTGRDPEACKVM